MRALALIAALALAAPAAAQTQAQMTAQAVAVYMRADAAMTREWRATYAYMKRRDASGGARVGRFGYAAAALESQRAWLKFRDAQCAIEGGEVAGGSMQPMVVAQCKAGLTTQRAAQLRNLRWTR